MNIIDDIQTKVTQPIMDKAELLKKENTQQELNIKIKDTLLVASLLTEDEDVKYHIASVIKKITK